MTCIIYILVQGELLQGAFPEAALDLSSWIMIGSLVLYPFAFLTTIRHVSWLSMYCTIAHVLVNAVIVIYCLTRFFV